VSCLLKVAIVHHCALSYGACEFDVGARGVEVDPLPLRHLSTKEGAHYSYRGRILDHSGPDSEDISSVSSTYD
jgi:hypothetical protein